MIIPSRRTWLGVSRLTDPAQAGQPLAQAELIEADTQGQPWVHGASLPAHVTIGAGFWYLLGESRAEQAERETLLEEICDRARALACVLRLTPSLLAREDGPRRILEFQKSWKIQAACPLYLDPGQLGPPAWSDPATCVSDPIWHSGETWSDYWKIHGWHSARWIRKYPEAELQALAKLALRSGPRFLILGHSQREAQYAELRRHLLREEPGDFGLAPEPLKGNGKR